MNIFIKILLSMLWSLVKNMCGIIIGVLAITYIAAGMILTPITIWTMDEAILPIKIIVTLLYVIPALLYLILEYHERYKKEIKRINQ